MIAGKSPASTNVHILSVYTQMNFAQLGARPTYLGPQPFCNCGVIGGTVLEGFPGQPLPVLQSFLGTAAA